MSHHKSQHVCNYTTKQLYDLVIDVESYPDFLPWCTRVEIIRSKGNIIIAEMVIEFANITQSYTSKVTFEEPHKIEVEMIEGPFNYLYNKWIFTELPSGETNLQFEIDFKFNSKLLEKLIALMFDRAVSKLTDAFLKRAEKKYTTGHLR